ncbi:MAG: hypothetical protein HYZ57_06730 [Acidobacteria bacterium]|nr:hypothetical protein [Acidobacteriota bacterium]
MLHVVLLGLADEVAESLACAVAKACGCCVIARISEWARGFAYVARRGCDVLFCPPNSLLVAELRRRIPSGCIIVVTRGPAVHDWLDAIDASASDYCAAPFDSDDLAWMIEWRRRESKRPAVAG